MTFRSMQSFASLLESSSGHEGQAPRPLPASERGYQASSTATGRSTSLFDMSQALDRLNRAQLQQIMEAEGIPPELCWLVSAWHQEMRYHVRHGTQELSIGSTTGVRQGCKIAPLLWTLLSRHILKRIGVETTATWMRASTSFFADDLHFYFDVCKVSDLERIQPGCAAVFRVLQDCHMLVNFRKSAVLISLPGTAAKKWRHRHVLKNQEGQWLRVRVGGELALLPIRNEHKYLGVILSYTSFEKETVKFRISQAATAFARLRGILCSQAKLA